MRRLTQALLWRGQRLTVGSREPTSTSANRLGAAQDAIQRAAAAKARKPASNKDRYFIEILQVCGLMPATLGGQWLGSRRIDHRVYTG